MSSLDALHDPRPWRRVVHLLDADPDLAEGLSPDVRRPATRLLRVGVIDVRAGAWAPPALGRDAFGLLVLGGVLVRRITLGPTARAEIIGPGDVIRPWDEDQLQSLVPAPCGWEAIADTELAVIDARASALLGRWPAVMVALGARMVRRSQCLAYLLAASHFARIENRLLGALWHFASLWGRVTPEGIVLPLPLTHALLAEVIGARRPSVTTALGALQRAGLVSRRGDGRFVLHGDPPGWDAVGPQRAEVTA